MVVFQLLIVLGQVVLQVLEKVDKRRRSLPMVLVHLVETAPSSPQSLSRLSLDSETKVLVVWCAMCISCIAVIPLFCRFADQGGVFINQETPACCLSSTHA